MVYIFILPGVLLKRIIQPFNRGLLCTYFDIETIFIPLSTIAVSVTAAVCPVSVTGQEPSSADQILIRLQFHQKYLI